MTEATVGLDEAPADAATLAEIPTLARTARAAMPPARGAMAATGGTEAVQLAPTEPLLVILVEFTDRSLSTTEAQWASAFFGTSGKTVRTYYDECSRGRFRFTPVNETGGTANDGIIRVSLNYPHPNTGGNIGDPNRKVVRDALTAADPFVNFAVLDLDATGGLSTHELHVVTIVARGEGAGGSRAEIGVCCHELAHDLGLPDLYDYTCISEGVGIHCLMAAGSWGSAVVHVQQRNDRLCQRGLHGGTAQVRHLGHDHRRQQRSVRSDPERTSGQSRHRQQGPLQCNGQRRLVGHGHAIQGRLHTRTGQ